MLLIGQPSINGPSKNHGELLVTTRGYTTKCFMGRNPSKPETYIAIQYPMNIGILFMAQQCRMYEYTNDVTKYYNNKKCLHK